MTVAFALIGLVLAALGAFLTRGGTVRKIIGIVLILVGALLMACGAIAILSFHP